MGKHFSEDSRVKIPALVHLSRLGYQYLSTKEIRTQVHKSTNKFRAFLNAAQVTVFSNNSEYDERETIPLSVAFYSTDGNDLFAHFREEEKAYLALHLAPLNQQVENAILRDTNLAAIKGTPAYQTNRSPDSPTNRLLPWFPHPYQGSHSWPFACRRHGGLCQH